MISKAVFVVLFILGVAVTNLVAAPKEGDLVQGSSTAVFLIHNGKRHGIESAKQFEEMGLKWENVIKISDADLNAIPLENEVTVSVKPYKTPKNGDLVQGNSPAVFLIRDGRRHGIENTKQFEEMGLKWENVIKISDADLNVIPLENVVTVPVKPYKTPKNGDLVQGSSAAVFLIQNGRRHGIKSAKQFEEMGLKWENVIKIPDADLNAIPLDPL